VPELFCCPEALLNTNALPLGELQEERGVVDDVRLPPWAHGDAFEFVRLNREVQYRSVPPYLALSSPYSAPI